VRPLHSLADFDALRSGRPTPVKAIARQDRALRDAGSREGSLGYGEIRTATYLEPLGRNQHLIETAAGDRIAVTGAQGSTTYSTGQRVMIGATLDGMTIIGSPPDGLVGASLFARSEISGSVDRPKVHTVEPADLPAGTTPVTFRGVGFSEDPVDVLSAIGPYFAGDETDPPGYPPFAGVTIGAVTWVSSTEIEADVTVSGPAVGARFGIRVDRG